MLCAGLDPAARSEVRDLLNAPPEAGERLSAAESYLRQLQQGRGRTPATVGGGDL